jgi:hypothetical protein
MGASAHTETEVIAGLEEELDSLYPEIDILTEISTKQQFVEPILQELQNHHGQLRIASHEKLDNVSHIHALSALPLTCLARYLDWSRI